MSENNKKKYEKPNAEEMQMVSTDLLNSMQNALQTATEALNKCREDVKCANDKYLRALADYQNLKRISDLKITSAKDSGKISVFKELLPVMDNFEKASDAGEVTEGVSIIFNNIKNIFNSNNVEIINPSEGESFNDSIHEAVAPVPGTDEQKNTIAFTQFKGYKMGDTILRYAKVGVYV